MILLELSGGLGNQLFEYAMARALLEKVRVHKPEEKITLLLNRYEKDPQRNYSLRPFAIQDSVSYIADWKQKVLALYFKIKKHLVMRLCTDSSERIHGEKNFSILTGHGMLCTTDVFDFYPYEIPKQKVKYVYGNFQSYFYFQEIEDIIRKELKVAESALKVDKTLRDYVNSSNSVAVHIRRGDYLSSEWSKSLNVCDEAYYVKAMEHILANVEVPVFFVFSNGKEDLEWIKQNMKLPGDLVYVDQNGSEIDDFQLMSECKHHIISNSTYSWWTSFLSASEGKIVVAPKEWYRTKDQQAKDIYLDSWTLIDVGKENEG